MPAAPPARAMLSLLRLTLLTVLLVAPVAGQEIDEKALDGLPNSAILSGGAAILQKVTDQLQAIAGQVDKGLAEVPQVREIWV